MLCTLQKYRFYIFICMGDCREILFTKIQRCLLISSIIKVDSVTSGKLQQTIHVTKHSRDDCQKQFTAMNDDVTVYCVQRSPLTQLSSAMGGNIIGTKIVRTNTIAVFVRTLLHAQYFTNIYTSRTLLMFQFAMPYTVSNYHTF